MTEISNLTDPELADAVAKAIDAEWVDESRPFGPAWIIPCSDGDELYPPSDWYLHAFTPAGVHLVLEAMERKGFSHTQSVHVDRDVGQPFWFSLYGPNGTHNTAIRGPLSKRHRLTLEACLEASRALKGGE